MTKLPALALAAAILPATGLCAAPGTVAGDTVTISYADLDLGTAQGAERLHRRVAAAAARVCRPENIRDLTQMRFAGDCLRAALDAAAPTIDLALANARTGRSYAAIQVVRPAALR